MKGFFMCNLTEASFRCACVFSTLQVYFEFKLNGNTCSYHRYERARRLARISSVLPSFSKVVMYYRLQKWFGASISLTFQLNMDKKEAELWLKSNMCLKVLPVIIRANS